MVKRFELIAGLLVAGLTCVAGAQATGASGVSARAGQAIFQPPAHPVTPEQVREIVEITHMRQNLEDSIGHSITMEKQSMPYLPDIFFSEMQKKISQLDMVAMFQAIYVKYISEEDAKGIIAFYKTPAGQSYLNTAPKMTQEVMDTFMQKGHEIGSQVAAEYKDEIDAAVKKYRSEHPAPANAAPAPTN